jgi:hypothetical protein
MLKVEKPKETEAYVKTSRDSKCVDKDDDERAPTLEPAEDSAAAGDVEAGGASPGGGGSPVSPTEPDGSSI